MLTLWQFFYDVAPYERVTVIKTTDGSTPTDMDCISDQVVAEAVYY